MREKEDTLEEAEIRLNLITGDLLARTNRRFLSVTSSGCERSVFRQLHALISFLSLYIGLKGYKRLLHTPDRQFPSTLRKSGCFLR